jgi:EpsI family protein
MQHPWVSDHLAFGWWLFGGMLLVLMAIDVTLSRRRPSRTGVIPTLVTADTGQTCSHGSLYRSAVLLLAAMLVISGPVLASLLDRQANTGQAVRIEWPAGIQGWSGPVETADSWEPRFHGAVSGKRAYQKNDHTVLLFLARYPVQHQGRELVSDLNRIANQPVWQLQYAHGRMLEDEGRTFQEQRMRSATGRQRLVWYWYRVAGVSTSNRYMAKLLQVYGLLVGEPEAALVAVAADVDGNPQDTRQQLQDFIMTTVRSL